MSVIGILTDFGLQDCYVGVMKAVITGICPQAQIIDIGHRLAAQDVRAAAFLLRYSFGYFPAGSVFLVVVDPGVGSQRRAVAVKTQRFYFVGPDNGVLFAAADCDGIQQIVQLDNQQYQLPHVSSTFHGRDVFAPAAAHLCAGAALSVLGTQISKIEPLRFEQPTITGNMIEGQIVYIDHFGNIVTNIMPDQLRRLVDDKAFCAELNKKKITQQYTHYEQAQGAEPFFVVGSFGFLEVSLRQNSAQQFFNAAVGDRLVVKGQL